MQVSTQSSANSLLARSKDTMDPQQQRLHKLFAQKQRQLGIDAAAPGGKGPDASLAAKAMKMAAKVDPSLATTAAGAPGAKSLGGPAGFGTTGATAPGTSTGSIAPLPAELAAELTVDGLMARWGSADTSYDLDASGTVDMKDLVMLLSERGAADGTPPPIPGRTKPAESPSPANSLGTTAPATEPAAPGDPATPASPADLTMDGLMKAWGTGEPAYDLDGDGTVGMNDLMAMLAASGVETPAGLGTTPDESGSGGGDGEPPAPALDLDGFAAAWGSDDAMYDLDGDGTVGMNDLLAHLAATSGNSESIAPNVSYPGALLADADAATPSLAATAPEAKDAKQPNATIADPTTPPVKGDTQGTPGPAGSLAATLDEIESAVKAMPTAGAATNTTTATVPAAVDVGSPATLDPALLGGPSSYWSMAGSVGGDGTMDLSTLAGLSDASVQAGAIESPEQAADVLSRQIHDRLESFGFSDAPPSNLHDILDGLQLGSGDRKMVLDRLQGMYPQGLGLNMVG